MNIDILKWMLGNWQIIVGYVVGFIVLYIVFGFVFGEKGKTAVTYTYGIALVLVFRTIYVIWRGITWPWRYHQQRLEKEKAQMAIVSKKNHLSLLLGVREKHSYHEKRAIALNSVKTLANRMQAAFDAQVKYRGWYRETPTPLMARGLDFADDRAERAKKEFWEALNLGLEEDLIAPPPTSGYQYTDFLH